jgi:tetratricopeptide repeat protein
MTCQTSARCCSGLLPIREEVSGPTHPDTLTARADLAEFTGEAGDPAAARDQYTVLLPTIEEVLGSTHPATLTTRANLAQWTALASGWE